MGTEERLKEKISSLIDDLEVVAGYTKSGIPLRINPLFIEKKEEIDKLIFNNLCINNLATYIYSLSQEIDGKIGVILKPCDVKAIVQLLNENLINRDKIKIISVECNGVVDYKKIQKKINGLKIVSTAINNNIIRVSTGEKDFEFNMEDVYAEKCYVCNIYNKPPIFDEFIENDIKFNIKPKKEYEDLIEFEKLGLEEIYSFWEQEFSRCIRCYACRNICPLEVCRDRCIAQLDQPHWQSQKITSGEGKFFQLIRVMHLAGRCVECGECERVCPSNIPILRLMKKMNREINRLFGFIPGLSADSKPPLLTFKNIEKNIKEEELI
ncbi:MAG: 4Fe-4S dicluster domain-containing protein [Actinobacteria bacterium]|nr:4Fe-4S dicluster domain-containing protein [Actinomycetota bacterium]